MCIHRSACQLKEADPHTFAIPRLEGRTKAAAVTIQADEYGNGVAEKMHSYLFGNTMVALGLDPACGRYLDQVPGVTLDTVNLVSMFGLHRRLRGSLVGHLAVFEMTSVGPMGRYSRGLERLGFGPPAREFFDVHVEADARHQRIATDELLAAWVAQEPSSLPAVLFGAGALMEVEARFSAHLLGSWEAGRSSLRPLHA